MLSLNQLVRYQKKKKKSAAQVTYCPSTVCAHILTRETLKINKE